jgi:hypothetical protein
MLVPSCKVTPITYNPKQAQAVHALIQGREPMSACSLGLLKFWRFLQDREQGPKSIYH